MIEFFKDRTGIITEDSMYPTRIQHKSPKDLCSLWFTDGEHTSRIVNDETFTIATSDGLPLFCPNHIRAGTPNLIHSNIILSAPALSDWAFDEACKMLWGLGSIPDTLITSSDGVMCQKAKEVQQYYEIKRGWKLNHIIYPHIKSDFASKYRWFVVDSRKATGHYKKLPAGFSEVCVFTWDWVVASLSVTQPVLS